MIYKAKVKSIYVINIGCSQCKSTNVTPGECGLDDVMSMGFVSLENAIYSRSYTCNDCGAIWKLPVDDVYPKVQYEFEEGVEIIKE